MDIFCSYISLPLPNSLLILLFDPGIQVTAGRVNVNMKQFRAIWL